MTWYYTLVVLYSQEHIISVFIETARPILEKVCSPPLAK